MDVIPSDAAALPAPSGKGYNLVGNENLPAKKFFGFFAKNTKTINVTGYCEVYINDDLDLTGASMSNPSTVAKRLKIILVGNHAVDVGGNSTQYMHLYAPMSTVRVHGTPGFHGWIVGNTLAFIGTSDLYYDESNKVPGRFLIRLVE